MKDPIRFIRLKIIAALNGNITSSGVNVLIYNRVPSQVSYPFIRVYSVSTNAVDDNQSKYNVECITRIEVATRFDGDSGGELTVNEIMNQITSILVSKNQSGFDLSSYNFNCYTSQNVGITYLEYDTSDHTYFRAYFELSNKIDHLT